MDPIFNYENLPTKHWKKYIYASRFVQLVRAKTPKVTYYSREAKCQLMETLEDFEVHFYEGGKIVKNSDDVKIFDCKGQCVPKEVVVDMWNHYSECLKHCINIERLLKNMHTDGECFPVIIGRRPTSAPILNTIKECSSPNALTPKLSNVRC